MHQSVSSTEQFFKITEIQVNLNDCKANSGTYLYLTKRGWYQLPWIIIGLISRTENVTRERPRMHTLTLCYLHVREGNQQA